MAAGYKPRHPANEPDSTGRGASRPAPGEPEGGAPQTRRWAPRANADAALPPLADLNPYDDDEDRAVGRGRAQGGPAAADPLGDDDDFEEGGAEDASESETGEQDRPDLDRIEHGGTEEFQAPSPRPRSGKRRATGPVLMPRDIEGPAHDTVAVPTRIEEPRIDLDLSLARRDEDDTAVPPRLRGRNLPADRGRSDRAERSEKAEKRERAGRAGQADRADDDDAPEPRPRSSDDIMMASFSERSGPRIWIVVAVIAAIGLIALLLGVTR